MIAIGPRFAARADAFASLGLRPVAHPTGAGDHIETDASGETAVNGVYAAGNIADPSNQVLQAAAEGSRIGAMISFSLAERGHARRGSAVGECAGLGRPLRRRAAVERQPERLARERDQRAASGHRAGRRSRRRRRRDLARRTGLDGDRERRVAACLEPGGGGRRTARGEGRATARRCERPAAVRRAHVRPGVGAVRIDPAHA